MRVCRLILVTPLLPEEELCRDSSKKVQSCWYHAFIEESRSGGVMCCVMYHEVERTLFLAIRFLPVKDVGGAFSLHC